MLKEQSFQGCQLNHIYASKSSGTFALHMEALDKHRGKDQQMQVQLAQLAGVHVNGIPQLSSVVDAPNRAKGT